jgi:hypothetical protein
MWHSLGVVALFGFASTGEFENLSKWESGRNREALELICHATL